MDRKEYQKAYREAHKDKFSEYQKKYRADHKKKAADYNKKYREENKDKLKDEAKKYRETHKKDMTEYYRKYRKDNADRIEDNHRRWRADNKAWFAFYHHRHAAKQRNIIFLLSFDDWFGVWKESGHWNDRGSKKGQYVMARYGDVGPYAIDNVKIIPAGDNVSEARNRNK